MLALLLFTVWQAIQVRMALNDVAIRMTTMVDQLAQGGVEQAETDASLAHDSAEKALTHTRGPIWWTASKLPWVGDDVAAVRAVSEVVEELTDDTIPELVEAGARFGPGSLAPRRGRIDLDPIPAIAPVLAEGADEIAAAETRVAGLETAGLVEELRGPIRDLQEKLGTAAGAASSAATAAELLPAMLGADAPRTYLAIFQNNAEIRSQGGLFGAMALLRADDGKVTMVEQGRPRDIGTFEADFIDLTQEEHDLFSTRLSIYPQNATSVPHFPRSGEILTQMWEERHPETIDGVVSIDPVAMSYLIRGTGPLQLPGGRTIDADNAAATLMRDAYLELATDEEQNAFFDLVAQRLFADMLQGPEDPRALLDGLVQATGERRLMLWSRHAEEQEKLSGTAIAGELSGDVSTRPEVGVFLQNSAADKLSYYLDYDVDVRPRSCGSEGNQVLDVRVKMRSTVPEGADLPPLVVGPSTNASAPGELLNTVYLYAPVDGRIDEVALDGEPSLVNRLSYRGREVGGLTVSLQPGQSRVIDYVLITGEDQTGDPRLTTTPAATTTGRGFIGRSAC